jgi:hypothetical protein
VPVWHGGQPCGDDRSVDESGVQERGDEDLVFSRRAAEFGDALVFLVQAPADVAGFAGGRGRVLVLDLDQPGALPLRQHSGVLVDSVDAETVLLLEW